VYQENAVAMSSLRFRKKKENHCDDHVDHHKWLDKHAPSAANLVSRVVHLQNPISGSHKYFQQVIGRDAKASPHTRRKTDSDGSPQELESERHERRIRQIVK